MMNYGMMNYLYGTIWYDELSIENKYDHTYVVECVYTRFVNKKHTKVEVKVIIFNEILKLWNKLYVQLYGGYTKWENHMRLVDKELIQKYTELLPDQN